MLTTKKQVTALFQFILLLFLLPITGCTPSGVRALLDGERLIREGNYHRAVKKLERATAQLPENSQAWNHLGLAYHGAGRAQEAVAAYRKALERDRNLAAVRYNLGCLYLEQNLFDPAIDELRSYTVLQPGAVGGWLKLATAHLRHQQFDAAERAYHRALQLQPGLPEALNSLGIIQLHRKRPREAYNYFYHVHREHPVYSPALLNLAIVSHQHLNHRAFALQKYREYLALDPKPKNWTVVQSIARQLQFELSPPRLLAATNAVASVALATPQAPSSHLIKSNRTAPATNLFVPTAPVATQTQTSPPAPATDLAAARPDPAPARVERPQTDRSPAQLASSSQPKASKPTEPPRSPDTTSAPAPRIEVKDAPEEKIGLLDRLNPRTWARGREKPPTPLPALNQSEPRPPQRPAEPLKVATAAIDLKPAEPARVPTRPPPKRYLYKIKNKPASGNRTQAQEFFNQGVGAQQQGRLSSAIAAYRQATRVDPSYFEAHYNLGLATYQTRQWDLSLPAYESALALEPNSLSARYNFALALQQANYPQDAANELERLLQEYPSETRAHFTLANLYAQELFQVDQARQHYLKVLEWEPQHPQATGIRYWLSGHPQL